LSRLLIALWLLQAGPQGTGVVTGVVRSANGTPPAGVRVYAVTYRDALEAAKSPPALDSLTVTDAAGKYRLELPPGRYHIASGSVASPTYYPGTTDISSARVITVAAGGAVPGIDFGSFVPANRTMTGNQFAPPGNGVLSGVLRYADGKPAVGIHVAAVPSAVGSSLAVSVSGGLTVYRVIGGYITAGGSPGSPVSDSSGAFRIENLRPDTYYLVAGYADAPVFYPGTTDVLKAKTIGTGVNSKIDALDFAVSSPSPGVSISGRVSTSSGVPADGAAVHLRNQNISLPNAGAFGLPVRTPPKETIVGPDGLFTFNDVSPGTFTVEALFSGIQGQIQTVVVTGQPMNSLEFVLPVAMFTGRIVMDDGSAVPNPQVFAEAIVTTVNNPNIVSSTIFPITANGTFTRLHEGGEYRFYLRVLPEEYEIKSMRFGAVDLSKETLKITGKEPVDVEVRVAKRTSPPASSEVRVSGTAIDGVSGLPVVGRVVLCCSASGPAERFSAPVKSDGSFEFAAIPPGKYTAATQPAQAKPSISVEGTTIDVGSQGLSGFILSTTPQFGQITATIMADGSVPLPENVRPAIVFTAPMGRVRVVVQRNPVGIYLASLPMGVKYDVTLENLPEGFAVKSVLGDAVPTTAAGANAQPLVILIERTVVRN
jgi:hypothetical protein